MDDNDGDGDDDNNHADPPQNTHHKTQGHVYYDEYNCPYCCSCCKVAKKRCRSLRPMAWQPKPDKPNALKT